MRSIKAGNGVLFLGKQGENQATVVQFPVAEKADNGPDPCRYCKYPKICGRIEKEGADE